MRAPTLSLVVLGLLLGAVAAPGCTGDDPAPAAGGGADASTPTPTPPSGGDASTDPDAGPTCAGFADCDNNPANGCETPITTETDCGACGRACGGTSTCVAGQCTAEVIASDLDHPFALTLAGNRALWLAPDAVMGCTTGTCKNTLAFMVDVTPTTTNPTPKTHSPHQIFADSGNFYYEKCNGSFDCAPAQCAVTGCKNGGSTYLKTSSGLRRPYVLFGYPGAVYTHQGIDGLQKFTLPPPSSNIAISGATYGIVDYFGGGWTNGAQFVWLSNDPSLANPTGGLFVCPIGGCPNSQPPSLLPPPIKLLSVSNAVAYTVTNKTPADAAVLSCAIAGCNSAGTILADHQSYVIDITSDAKDVVWAAVGAADPTTNTAATGSIMRCSLPACAGGPVTIANQLVNPVGVQMDDEYIYWITYGTGTNKDGTLSRRRR